jgi:uncharacterized protein
MQLLDGQIILSATDLTGHLACEHLSALDLAGVRGEIDRPRQDDPEGDVLRRRGDEHERRYLEHLRSQGLKIVELDRPEAGLAGLQAAEAATLEAMASGAGVVYQGTFFDGRWRGHPDFLRKVNRPCQRWDWSYEVEDTKLARQVKGAAILQTCSYSEQLARLQDAIPEQIHIVGGDFTVHSYRLSDYAAYFRRVKAAVEEATSGPRTNTYPEPVDHCQRCVWFPVCEDVWRTDDHLSLVAGIRKSQIRKLRTAGFGSVEELGASPPGDPIPRMEPNTADRLRHQARLQLEGRRSRSVQYELLDSEEGRGLSLLPPPSPGDLFFDIEGDPFVEGGLEYLFGVVEIGSGEPVYHEFWAHDRAEEKAAFEGLVDFISEHLARSPDMHVYHYAAYEVSALKRLMGAHGTREEAVDRLLRGGVFVDLFRVVRQAVRVSQESYSLKELEPLYMAKREDAISTAASSVVVYEEYLLTGDEGPLGDIAAYNRTDCESTWLLRRWLEQRREELELALGESLSRPELREGDPSEAQAAVIAETRELATKLVAGLPQDPERHDSAEHATWLLVQLLDWHRREQRPEWWAHFARLGATEEELLEDAEAIAGLTYEGEVAQVAKSIVHRYRFPTDQEHKIHTGKRAIDPATGKGAGKVVRVDPREGILDLSRAKTSKVPHPRAVIPEPPVDTAIPRQAVARVGQWVAEHGIDADGPYRAVRDLLLGLRPRLSPAQAGQLVRPDEEPLGALRRLARALDGGCLPVQGPPGSGKTYAGARMVVDLVAAGRRVGITALSHRAITNLLDEVCKAADEAGVSLRILQKANNGELCTAPCVESADYDEIEARLADGTVDVVAGTSWLFAREAMNGTLDVVVVDEAGQMSLANVVAVGGAGRNLVLLGDPQQLAQPSKGTHPAGAGASALEHLLAGAPTVAPDRGVLLDVTWRLHPDLCAFVSEAFYESRLTAHESCAQQHVGEGPWAGGTGLRFVPVEHSGNRVASDEEAAEVAAGVNALLGRPWTDRFGQSRTLGVEDILVVAPFNAQVTRLRAALPAGIKVGTVDKFQGQEAAVVIFSMAASSGDDLPRGLEFLLSLNRINVAVSRARALTVLVCSPRLLELRCQTPTQMRLANALCRLVELTDKGAVTTGDMAA